MPKIRSGPGAPIRAIVSGRIRQEVERTGLSVQALAVRLWPHSNGDSAARRLSRLITGEVWPGADDLAVLGTVLDRPWWVFLVDPVNASRQNPSDKTCETEPSNAPSE